VAVNSNCTCVNKAQTTCCCLLSTCFLCTSQRLLRCCKSTIFFSISSTVSLTLARPSGSKFNASSSFSLPSPLSTSSSLSTSTSLSFRIGAIDDSQRWCLSHVTSFLWDGVSRSGVILEGISQNGDLLSRDSVEHGGINFFREFFL
jgi:hypothetical protein